MVCCRTLAGSRGEEEVSSNLSFPGALMPFYPVMPPDATQGRAEDAALGLLGQADVVAVRAADLVLPARQGWAGWPDSAGGRRGGPDPVGTWWSG
jgi:hypothetical protein